YASARSIAGNLDVPAIRLDGPARDGEAQSHAAVLPGAADVHAIEAIENTILMRCGNARSGVPYLDDSLARVLNIRFDADRAAMRRVLDGVVYQIHEGLAHQRRVAAGMNLAGGSEHELLLFLVGQHTQLIDDVSRQRAELQRLRRQLDLSRVGAREGEQTFDQPR